MDKLPQTITLATVDFAELNSDATAMRELSKELVIDSQSTYELVAEEVISVKSRIKAVEEQRMTITAPLTAAHKATMDFFRVPLAMLDEAKTFYESGMKKYLRDQKAIADAEQARVETIAQAERDRLEAEAAKKAQEALKLRGKAAVDAKLEAEQLALKAQETVAVIPQTVQPSAKGTSTSTKWTGECFDVPKALRFVLDNPAYMGLFQINQSVLNSFAKSQQKAMNIDGCRAVPDIQITSRTK
jgi:hypothetical protein